MEYRGRSRDGAPPLDGEVDGPELSEGDDVPEVRFEVVPRGFGRSQAAVKVLSRQGRRPPRVRRHLTARRETLILTVASVSMLFLVGWISDLVLYWYAVGILGSYDTYRAQVDEAWVVAVGSAVLMFLSLSHYARLKREGVR